MKKQMILIKTKKIICSLLLMISMVGSCFFAENRYSKASAEESYPILPINEFSTVKSFAGGTITKGDSQIDLTSAAYSGALYTFPSTGSYGYKTRIKPITTAGENIVYFSIGDSVEKTNTSSDFKKNGGYHIVWGTWGTKIHLKKDGENLSTQSAPIIKKDKTYNIELSMIDVDESSTRVIFKIDDIVYLNYLDENNPLKPVSDSGKLDNVIWTVWNELTIYEIKAEYDYPSIALNKMSSAKPYSGSSVTINENSVKILSGSYSGVTYSYSKMSSYGYKAKIHTGTTTNVIIHFVIGDTAEKSWSSSDHKKFNGYMVTWNSWGTALTLKDVSNNVELMKIKTSITTSTDYDIEFALIDIGAGGLIKVDFKVNGVSKLNCLVSNFSFLSPVGVFYNSIWTESTVLTIYNESDHEDISIHSSNVGFPVVVPDTQESDLNGNVSFKNGIAYYQSGLNNVLYNFSVSFSQINTGASSAFIIMLDYTGEPGKYNSSSWVNKGYALKLYPNGMREIIKDGQTITGPDWYGQKLEKDTEYIFRVGTYSPYDGAVKFVCYVNDKKILDYEDQTDPIFSSGSLAIQADSASGRIGVIGCPTIQLLNVPEQAFVGDFFEASYSDPNEGDVVEYFVDTTKSTATGYFNENVLKITSAGYLYVYAKVNGYYTNVIEIICNKVGVYFDNLPSTFIVGNGTLKAEILVNTGATIERIEYSIVEGKNIASIDSSGLVTLSGVGKIRIRADVYCEGDIHYYTEEGEGLVVIKPQLSLDFDEINIGEEKVVSSTINTNNTNKDTFEYKLLGEQKYASFSNNVLKGLKEGNVVLDVTFARGKEYETSEQFDISVIGVKMYLPDSPIIFGNGNGQIKATYSNGNEPETVQYFAENGSGSAKINKDTGELEYLSAGTITVYAILDGVSESKHSTLVINPKIELDNTVGMAVGAERTISYRSNCPLPENENIIVKYELLKEIGIDGKPGDVVDFDEKTGHVVAKAIGTFTVRINVFGETFRGYSSIDGTTIAVENPMVVVTKVIEDMYIGETQTIEATLGNGEIPNQEKSIVVTSGAELVEIDGMKIKALQAGVVSLQIDINGYLGVTKQIVISPIKVLLVAGDMDINSTQELDYILNADDLEITSVEYEIITGNDLAIIEDGILISGNKGGDIEVKVTINDRISSISKIHIRKNFNVVGVKNNQEVYVWKTYTLYAVNDDGTVLENVDFKIIGSNATVKRKTKTATEITIVGEGKITIEISYNGEDQEPIVLNAVEVAMASISVTSNPTKTEYELGEQLDLTGLVITGTYNDGSTTQINDYSVSGFNSSESGTQTITVTYNGFTTTFEVTVKEAPARGCGGNVTTTSTLLACISLIGISLVAVGRRKKHE